MINYTQEDKPMRMCLFSCILCFVIASPALSELTPQDLDKIRLIVSEEVKKESADTKTELKEYINLKITNVAQRFEARFDGIDVRFKGIDDRFKGIDDKFRAVDDRFKGIEGQIALTINLVYALIALIVAALAIPQILIAWRGRLDTTRDRNIEELARKISEQAEEIEMLK